MAGVDGVDVLVQIVDQLQDEAHEGEREPEAGQGTPEKNETGSKFNLAPK